MRPIYDTQPKFHHLGFYCLFWMFKRLNHTPFFVFCYHWFWNFCFRNTFNVWPLIILFTGMPRVKPKQSVPLRRSKRLQNKADARNLEAQSNWVDVKGNDEDFNWEEFVREGLEAELSDKNESEKRRWFNRSCVHHIYIEEPASLVSSTCNAGRWTGKDLL